MARPQKPSKKIPEKKKAPIIPEKVQPWIWTGIIGLVTLWVYAACFHFELTYWDDRRYILETPLIHSLSWDNIKDIFSFKVLESYNPLVILNFAVDYHFAKEDAGYYHTMNVLFHVMNSMLLFWCMRSLKINKAGAVIVALLFALHPLHVESVGWIASRKDVLFTFFFLLSWIAYLRYSTARNYWFYGLSFFLFLLSLFSKSQAVTLPLVFLLSDYLTTSKLRLKNLTDKIPFLLVAIVFGYYVIHSSTLIADKYQLPPTFGDKIYYSILAFGIYVFKFFVPINQSAIYAFPENNFSGSLPELLGSIALILATGYLLIKTYRKYPLIAFGLLFFCLNIFLTLHIIAVNSSLIYERFTYIAYIGLALVIAGIPENILKRFTYDYLLFIPVFLVLLVLTRLETKVWKDNQSLWLNVIDKNPRAYQAYTNLGAYYNDRGEYDKALPYLNESIRLNPKQPAAYNNRSIVYYYQKDYPRAIADVDSALRVEPDYAESYGNAGLYYFSIQKYDTAVMLLDKALKLKPNYPSCYVNRAAVLVKLNRPDDAIRDYQKAIYFYPEYADAYKFLAIAYFNKNDLDSARSMANYADRLNSAVRATEFLSNEIIQKGNLAFRSGNNQQALEYYTLAAEVYPSSAEAYYDIGGIYYVNKDLQKARENWHKALELNADHKEARAWLEKTGGL